LNNTNLNNLKRQAYIKKVTQKHENKIDPLSALQFTEGVGRLF